MNPGKLTERVELQERTLTDGYAGERVPIYVTRHTRWAMVVENSQSEGQAVDRKLATKTYSITLRSYAALDTTWRVKWGDQVLDITSAINDPAGFLTLTCTERV